MELSGADLLAALENGVSRVEDVAGRFPQVAGLALVYDPAAPAGSRVVEVTVGGAPLDPAKIYTVATNDYMAGGGDGYASLGNGKQLIDASGATLLGHHGHGLCRGEGRGGAGGGRSHQHPLTRRRVGSRQPTHARFREAGDRYGTDAGDVTACQLIEDDDAAESFGVAGRRAAPWKVTPPARPSLNKARAAEATRREVGEISALRTAGGGVRW